MANLTDFGVDTPSVCVSGCSTLNSILYLQTYEHE